MLKIKVKIRDVSSIPNTQWTSGDKIICIETHNAGFGETHFMNISYFKGKVYTIQEIMHNVDTLFRGSGYNPVNLMILEGGAFSNHADKFKLFEKRGNTK